MMARANFTRRRSAGNLPPGRRRHFRRIFQWPPAFRGRRTRTITSAPAIRAVTLLRHKRRFVL